MVSVCLPSDALLQHLPTYLGFSYLGRGVSLHCCSSKAQPLLLTLDAGCLLTAALPDLQCGIAPLGPPAPSQPRLQVTPLVAAPGLGLRGVGCSSRPPPLASGLGARIGLLYYSSLCPQPQAITSCHLQDHIACVYWLNWSDWPFDYVSFLSLMTDIFIWGPRKCNQPIPCQQLTGPLGPPVTDEKAKTEGFSKEAV